MIKDNDPEVYGYLWLYDGTEVSLDGTKLSQVRLPSTVKSYGQHEIGDEANVFLRYKSGKGKVVTGIKHVRRLFK